MVLKLRIGASNENLTFYQNKLLSKKSILFRLTLYFQINRTYHVENFTLIILSFQTSQINLK